MENIAFVVLASLCFWAIVDKHVHTGIMITLGLMLVVAACLAMIDNGGWINRAMELMVYGCLSIAGGLLWERYVGPYFARFRISHAIDSVRPPPVNLSVERQKRWGR